MMIQRNRHPRDKVGYPNGYSMSWVFSVSWSELIVLDDLERSESDLDDA
jgi:hypothetical protein